jgi:hypothetical protein
MNSTDDIPLPAVDSFEALRAYWRQIDALEDLVRSVAAVSDDKGCRQADRILAQIDSFEPKVTLIGQVKAGKTALINALAGQPGLLPSDVNPWTSVVTSLHINSRRRPEGARALFQFFDHSEWERLIATGGRLGELARRSGFEDERAEVRRQVEEMHVRTRDRLGDRFEQLLGTSHTFASFDTALVNRYVCYGEAAGHAPAEGHFADITKLASLYLDLPGLPPGLCFRDTPGVNDTFMMREQITLNSIRDSRLCILVLSAHQAMSTMDLALLRLIANVQAREVILFVNRIDELADPVNDARQIERNLRATLAAQAIDADLTILFGSAYWANHALRHSCDTLTAASLAALEAWSEGPLGSRYLADCPDIDNIENLVWALSGVPELRRVVASRIVEGPGAAMLADLRDKAANLVNTEWALDREVLSRMAGRDWSAQTTDRMTSELTRINAAALDSFAAGCAAASDELRQRLRASQQRFAERAVEALISHISTYGESDSWQYNPAGLRMMLRTAYLAFGAAVARTTNASLDTSCAAYGQLFQRYFEVGADRLQLKTPQTARLDPPTTVGQTLVLDLNRGWWRRFFGSLGGQKRAIAHYSRLIHQETDAIVAELLDKAGPEHIADNRRIVEEFLEGQAATATGFASSLTAPAQSASNPGGARQQVLETVRQHLTKHAA